MSGTAYRKHFPVASNSEGARLAAEQPDAAAIGPETAAQMHQLNLVARDIEDAANYKTITKRVIKLVEKSRGV